MCRIDLCGQIGVKISSYGDRQFIKINPLIRPWGRIIRREDRAAPFFVGWSPLSVSRRLKNEKTGKTKFWTF